MRKTTDHPAMNVRQGCGRLTLMRPFSVMMFCLLLTLRLAAAEAGENEAFNAAARAFQDGFYERAAKELADFAQKFPNSDRLAEAFLFQAQSSFQLKRYEPRFAE